MHQSRMHIPSQCFLTRISKKLYDSDFRNESYSQSQLTIPNPISFYLLNEIDNLWAEWNTKGFTRDHSRIEESEAEAQSAQISQVLVIFWFLCSQKFSLLDFIKGYGFTNW